MYAVVPHSPVTQCLADSGKTSKGKWGKNIIILNQMTLAQLVPVEMLTDDGTVEEAEERFLNHHAPIIHPRWISREYLQM